MHCPNLCQQEKSLFLKSFSRNRQRQGFRNIENQQVYFCKWLFSR